MDCQASKDVLLADYLDGELSLEMKFQVDEHLKNCSSCREFLSAVKAQDNMLIKDDSRQLSSDVWEAIEERLDESGFDGDAFWKDFWLWFNSPRLALACASVLFLVIMVFSFVRLPYQQVASSINYGSIATVFEEVWSDEFFEDQNGLGTVVEYFL